MQPDDQTLILRAQRGDDAAFETLVRRYDRTVLSIALRYTGDPETAKDIYQDVFLRVHTALPRFRFESQFSTWLHRITVNCCLNYHSARPGRRDVSLESEVLESSNGSTLTGRDLPEALVDASDPLRPSRSREIRRRLAIALDRLSPQQKLVFVLRHFEGRRLREIAEVLQCAEGTVKKHLFSGTQRLREQLSELR
jgi:RNA polymerase sigma-70 factor (ECF subfamily)